MPNNLRFDEYRDMKWITIVFIYLIIYRFHTHIVQYFRHN